MIVIDCEQGSDEWKQARCGKITASRISDLLTRTSSGAYGAGRRNYMAELVVERMTGIPTDGGYQSPEMRWGTEQEPMARVAIELALDLDITKVGFVIHDDLQYTGASPDGLIGSDTGVEIKCPNTANHIEALETGKVPTKYLPQMQWNMFVTGRRFWKFASYDPRMKDPRLELFLATVEYDERWISDALISVEEFEKALQDKIANLEQIAARRAAV